MCKGDESPTKYLQSRRSIDRRHSERYRTMPITFEEIAELDEDSGPARPLMAPTIDRSPYAMSECQGWAQTVPTRKQHSLFSSLSSLSQHRRIGRSSNSDRGPPSLAKTTKKKHRSAENLPPTLPTIPEIASPSFIGNNDEQSAQAADVEYDFDDFIPDRLSRTYTQ